MNYFSTLPNELLYDINEKLDYKSLKNLRLTNYQLYSALDPSTYQRLLNDKLENLIDDIVENIKSGAYNEDEDEEDENIYGVAFSYEKYIEADQIRLDDFEEVDENPAESEVVLNYTNDKFTIRFIRQFEEGPINTEEERIKKILRTIITNNYELYDITGRNIY